MKDAVSYLSVRVEKARETLQYILSPTTKNVLKEVSLDH